ncbi:hypothetical protein LTR70_000088 [Exophiala xenobiotica]|uniref:Uncharacterized protein n=1 Tax=Lithohypha guttulata TaxID=1690604 RepID=A0ABR0KQ66_9EURO|nr:hypothetical protein LTR24_000213 [Lithohypha guttulata]KAK5330766.1 hypothetical protein LTR70_000088 [Exophiala xenobiotica]
MNDASLIALAAVIATVIVALSIVSAVFLAKYAKRRRVDRSYQASQEEVEMQPPSQHRPISTTIAPLPPPPIPHARPFSPLGEQAPPGAALAHNTLPRPMHYGISWAR